MLPFPEKRVGKFLLISAQNSGKHNHHLQRGLWCEFLLNLTLRAEEGWNLSRRNHPLTLSSLLMFLPEFLLKLLLIQPEVNHNPIQSFHLNQEFSLIKFTSPQGKLQV